MVQIALIRPGSTDFDAQARIQGTLEIPLNEEGRRQAASIVDCLKSKPLTVLYSTACQSARETAEIIGERLGMRAKTLDKLKNLDHGLWQGMLIEDVKRKHPTVYRQWQENPHIVCPPDGEMITALESRVAVVMEKLVRKHRFGTIGLVAPEPLASVIRRWILGAEMGDLWKASNGCNRVELFEMPATPRGRTARVDAPVVRETIVAQTAVAPAMVAGSK